MIRIRRYHGGRLSRGFPIFKPSEVRDIELDLTSELHGDTLSSCTWTSHPTGATFSNNSVSGQTASITITAPSSGKCVIIKAVAVTSGGETIQTRVPMKIIGSLS